MFHLIRAHQKQKTCPQVLMTGLKISSRQMGQVHSSGASCIAKIEIHSLFNYSSGKQEQDTDEGKRPLS